jgi:glycerol-3-phosphate acyltransferase PlsY
MTDMTLGDGIALLQRRSRLVKGLLVAGLVILVLVLVGQLAELRGLVSLDEEAPVEGFNALYLGVSVIDFLLALITYILFCMWIYRAAANVKAARVSGFTFTPAWAVGWHFVPIANFFRPFQAMRQIWNASHGGDGVSRQRGELLLICWWGVWSFSLAVSAILTAATIDANSPAEEREAVILAILYSVTNLILYPLGWRLVDRLTRAQGERLVSAQIFS